MKKFLITEEEKKRILGLYQIIKEDSSNLPGDIVCDDNGCKGTYKGPEFNSLGDIAHQFSNKMSDYVGKKLKELYNNNVYSKVDLNNIEMSTPGMGTGNVVYSLVIPFIKVQEPCQAYTSFDHVGGWGHSPDLNKRKQELASALLLGDELNISNLLQTKEGLQEYWIQWRNKTYQSSCQGHLLPKDDTNIIIKGDRLLSVKTSDGGTTDDAEKDFKAKINGQTKNISIDLSSVNFDGNNLVLQYNEGDTDIYKMSYIWDNISNENLESRLDGIKSKNTEYKIEVFGEDGGKNPRGFYWRGLIFIIK